MRHSFLSMLRLALLVSTSCCHAFVATTTSPRLTSLLHSDDNSNTDITSTTIPTTRPLPSNTFAGMVEHAIIERFGNNNVDRVLESWRLLDMDYEHRQFVGYEQDPPIQVDDPSTSKCHQHSHSYVPGLKATQFYNTNDFQWCKKLESKYKELRKEFDLVQSDSAKLQTKGNNVWAGALTEDASSYGVGWKTLVLMDRGIWDPINVNLFPKTALAVRDLGIPVTEVFFASMDANSNIAPHSDFTNFVVTSHLGLDIPGENKCRLTIGDDTRSWKNGEVMMFDTSIIHEAVNEAEETRYILMMRVWHPDLTSVEREALQFIYDCLALPDLTSTDPATRFRAELELEAMKTFPKLETATTSGGGFGNSKKQKKKKKPKSKGFA
mmetsp:Transcript_6818/g.9952  ORF Transcript_6818/g.9952 Transcript_6818/m.9952 type:complete len:381 (-) Transcript_6818:174-1316(-)